jgi:putative aldouronate transport system substrate-binding protein
VQYPGYVEEICTWLADASQYLVEPPLYGLQISEPSQYASIGAGFPDLEADIARGRRPISALDDAVKEWKAAGGDQLRTFYAELLDKQ